ncbi:MAG: tRNA (adenosine(37)-N6)-threonylcarbamoyltransferase complex transferase subunit TsaD [Candidatus Coatesbacteria bacterium]|nr:tRNA (adenosine(37)-N6)-threonylcarbamoyltransferase complex transferase subunit TsaD [Candidatus Coatesbacteria bacterium]
MLILGLETSCDETAAAVLDTNGEANGEADDRKARVRSDIVSSQADFFAAYGGVVPELASRNHAARILPVVRRALAEAKATYADLDAVAATYGPGLTGALLVGLNFGKALAWGLGVPFVGVNHLAAHLQAPLLAEGAPRPPFVGLLVSGGHTALYAVDEAAERPGLLEFELLGETVDDAVGEAYDKVGRLLGVDYPAGPTLDRWAGEYSEGYGGDSAGPAEGFTRPMPAGLDFSFAGLKTAAARRIAELAAAGGLDDARKRSLAAGFQTAAVETLGEKALAACARTGLTSLIVGGGVAANSGLRAYLGRRAAEEGVRAFFAPLRLCTDNAVMIAARGRRLIESGLRHDLDLEAVACLELGVEE